MVCRWCGETANSEITAREMMFGFRDRFVYEKCSACGGLQIQDIPEVIALSKYYPAEFWSHKLAEKNALIPEWLKYGVLRWLLDDRYAKFISLIPSPSLRSAFWRALKYRIKRDHKVLDVGCGTGSLICALADIGIKAPIGVDPFIEPSTITYTNGATVIRSQLADLHAKDFDVIIFNHSLEHIPDPVSELKRARERLRSGGLCVVSIPTVSSEAFEIYGEHWIQLDAPRHLCIPSRAGMDVVAEKCGMHVEDVLDDSSDFQFWGSEQYVLDIPLRDPKSYFINRNNSIFTQQQLDSFSRRAKALNDAHRGDQATFFLRKLS